MICVNPHRLLTDEEKSRYQLTLCEGCRFHDNCELLSGYLVNQVQKVKSPPPVAIAIPWTKAIRKSKPANSVVVERERNRSIEPLPFYMQEGFCSMKSLYQVECGNQWVAEGIGDDFKVNVKYDYKTDRYIVDKSSYKRGYFTQKWESRQFVGISAQTGNGKNTFIENVLLPYIRELNHKNETELKVLILSNRIALKLQEQDRIKNGVVDDDKVFYSYGDYADVMSYQSILNKVEFLKRVQEQKRASYIFVICDEPHFFTSDAMFNPDTEKILEAIVNIFKDAIRVYMSATLYECLEFIKEKEAKHEKHIPGILYHFKRDYSYLNTKYFSDEKTELRDIIINNVAHYKEKWLIFIDNKSQGAAFKKLLEENDDGEATPLKGKVMTISAESKDKDEKYQQMIVNERFDKDISVVIATSVVDNGVNFRDVENIVITDLNRTKCLQMVGRVRVDKISGKKVTLYIKRHNESVVAKRIKAIGIQQDAYHDYDMAAIAGNYNFEFRVKYEDKDVEDWENKKHWFGREKKDPDKLYPNEIARSLADKYGRIYESILEEMEMTDKGKAVTGQKYLEYQLSWFGKRYSKKNDITLYGYKTDNQLSFEQWIQTEWLDKKIPKEGQKDFGKKFFECYYPKFGFCYKKYGFSTDDNRRENGPKSSGYSVRRIKEIFQVKKMPFDIIEDNDYCVIVRKS